VAAWSEVWACGRSPAEVVGSISAVGMDVCRLECCVAGRDLCDELITRPEESSPVSVCACVCVCVCVSLIVI